MHITCDTCGITIDWQPTLAGDKTYCCTGCAAGGPCTCDYGQLPRREDQAAITVADRRQHLPVPRSTRRSE